jgi:hypothetical protein
VPATLKNNEAPMGSLITGPLVLWLPILVSAVLVFLASSVIHMGPFWHRGDYPAMPQEAQVLAALRPLAIPPGDYMLPRAGDMKTYKTPQFTEKLRLGPVAVLTVLPNGPFSMGRNLAQWFIYLLVLGVLVAAVAGDALPAGASYPTVFRLVAAVAFIGHCLALAQMSIWYRRSWTLTLKSALDGLIYGALTGGTVGWLWPR